MYLQDSSTEKNKLVHFTDIFKIFFFFSGGILVLGPDCPRPLPLPSLVLVCAVGTADPCSVPLPTSWHRVSEQTAPTRDGVSGREKHALPSPLTSPSPSPWLSLHVFLSLSFQVKGRSLFCYCRSLSSPHHLQPLWPLIAHLPYANSWYYTPFGLDIVLRQSVIWQYTINSACLLFF